MLEYVIFSAVCDNSPVSMQWYDRKMKISFILVAFASLLSVGAHAEGTHPRFDRSTGTIVDSRWKSGVPLGGIGDGKIELLSDGSFGNFTHQDNWDKPYGWAKGAFAAVSVRPVDGTRVAKILRLTSDGEFAGVDNIAHTRMQGWFPRGHIDYVDNALPVRVSLDAFSPLIPHDVKNSCMPVAFLDYSVTNTSKKPVQASMLLAWPNLLGWGDSGANDPWTDLSGDAQTTETAGKVTGLRYTTSQSYPSQHQNVVGEDFVGVRSDFGANVTVCPSWDAAASTPSFWAGFRQTGKLQAEAADVKQPAGAVALDADLKPGETRVYRFRVVWAMPHLVTVQERLDVKGTFDKSTDGVDNMLDDDPKTRWGTGRAQQIGDNLVIDLGREVTPTLVALDSGVEATDYPRGLRVDVSNDGTKWTEVAKKSADVLQGAHQDIDLTPTAGHYLRLTDLGSDSGNWWSVVKLAIHVKEQTDPLRPASITAYKVHTDNVKAVEDVGRYWQNWWDGAKSIADYADRNETSLLEQTKAWQEPVRQSSLPFWLKLKLVNCAFPMFANTVLTKDGRFAVLESPICMGGALGTMDQRMAAHAYLTAFFPELDRAELEMYATCQQPDGRITHFDGNVHEVIGRPDVGYGITDWPDLSSSWVMQAVKLYRWTGDTAFLKRVKPHIDNAMSWLQADGVDDDLIPAGGSTYDYEHLPRGEFIYSASCYLGALRAAAAVSDPKQAKVINAHLADVQKSVMRDLWNGKFFRKWRDPVDGKTVEDSFIANQAGDWLARLTGLPRTLPAPIIHQSMEQTIARHLKPFYPVPPMQSTPDGRLGATGCYLLQHEPYLGCEAIYENYVDSGLETLYRVYLSAWELNHSPWDESLAYDTPGGGQGWLYTYMTSPTSWHVLNALAGTSIDVPSGRLFISPRLATSDTETHLPIYFSRFWGWLDYVPARGLLTLKVARVCPVDAMQKSMYHAAGETGDDSPDVVIRSIAADGDSRPIRLDRPFDVKEGATLDLSAYIVRLNLPKRSETVDFEVKAPAPQRPGLPSGDWTLSDNLHDSPEIGAISGEAALDGDSKTRWTTARQMQPGDQVTLDMHARNNISRLVLDSTDSPGDYPRGCLVETSVDGSHWRVVARADGDRVAADVKGGLLSISFAQVDARYVRITNEGTAQGAYWSIHELTVYRIGGAMQASVHE